MFSAIEYEEIIDSLRGKIVELEEELSEKDEALEKLKDDRDAWYDKAYDTQERLRAVVKDSEALRKLFRDQEARLIRCTANLRRVNEVADMLEVLYPDPSDEIHRVSVTLHRLVAAGLYSDVSDS